MSGLRTELASGLGTITLDRPPLNVLATATMIELAGALRALAADPAVRVVRLDAAGRAFSAGVDVADHEGDKLGPMMDSLADLMRAFEDTPQPIVAVVQGACLGGGLELVLACDLALASRAASFGQPEIKLGVFAPPASVLLPRVVGERRALELLLAGDTIPADEARAIGLVNAVVPADELREASTAWIARLLALSGAALRRAKRAVVLGRTPSPSDAHARVNDLYLNDLMATADAAEGLRAFVEKRPPVWTHR